MMEELATDKINKIKLDVKMRHHCFLFPTRFVDALL